MPRATPDPKFPNTVWDGLTSTTPDVSIEKPPDTEMGNRLRAEIRALEATMLLYIDLLDQILDYGPANSVLGVIDDGTDVEYKELIEGTGIVITHAAGRITISGSEDAAGVAVEGIAGETLAIGDLLYVQSNGKAYKAQANAVATSMVIGMCDRVAILDDEISILQIGSVINVGWSLTVGTLYYLSPGIAGAITETPPTMSGYYVIPVGVATSATKLAISLKVSVLL